MSRPVKPLKRRCDTPKRALGAVITELRIPRQWGYQHVARLVGCDDSYMLRVEHGTENPSFDVLKAIADLYKMKFSQLIARAERKYENCKKKG